jgi:hypothetical protein
MDALTKEFYQDKIKFIIHLIHDNTVSAYNNSLEPAQVQCVVLGDFKEDEGSENEAEHKTIIYNGWLHQLNELTYDQEPDGRIVKIKYRTDDQVRFIAPNTKVPVEITGTIKEANIDIDETEKVTITYRILDNGEMNEIGSFHTVNENNITALLN